jgi:hypothetical protein
VASAREEDGDGGAAAYPRGDRELDDSGCFDEAPAWRRAPTEREEDGEQRRPMQRENNGAASTPGRRKNGKRASPRSRRRF